MMLIEVQVHQCFDINCVMKTDLTFTVLPLGSFR